MRIKARVHAGLQRHTDGASAVDLEVATGTTVTEMMDQLGVPSVEVYSVVINRRVATEETVLQDGDQVDLIPPIGGGA